MWNSVFSGVSSAASSAWDWFNGLFDSIPGAWAFLSMVILIYLICKHLLAPLVGGIYNAGISDRVKAYRKANGKSNGKGNGK